MTRPRLLIDNDIFILLAGCGLLEEAVALLGFALEECVRLDALPHMLKRSKHLIRQYDQGVREEALRLCELVPATVDEVSETTAQRLSNVRLIDRGELVLFATLVAHPHFMLTTGDKQAMRALACTEALADLRTIVAGRIICLETLLLKLMQTSTAESMGNRLLPVRETNKELRAAFSDGNIANPGQVLAALESYRNQLISEVGPGFLYEG